MGVSDEFHAPAALQPPERAPGNHWIGGWVGPRPCLDAVVKEDIPPPVGNRTPVVQPMA